MGEVKGYLKYERKDLPKRSVEERLKDWKELYLEIAEEELRQQGARCMDCGVPFCHWGCPLGNVIPDLNDLAYRGKWEEAVKMLYRSNNFPDFTGRICPALCENSCVLAINQPAVTIKNIEREIVEKGYELGIIKPHPPKIRTGRKVAIVGSGPAGLACADQLNKAGHSVVVYEKNEFIGGLLTLGIPEFKLEKRIVRRRLDIMEAEGVEFKTEVYVGKDISLDELRSKYDAIVLCNGAEQPRDLPVPGRELKGIYFAMEYLTQQTRILLGCDIKEDERITAKGKKVLVIGGGDTGSDCVGTANRQGAVSVKQFELLPRPPKERAEDNPWPEWAIIERKSTSHEEGVEQEFQVMTKAFLGEGGIVKKVKAVRLEFGPKDPQTGRRPMKEIAGTEFEIEVDLVLLAMGFLGPVKSGIIEQAGIELNERGAVKTDDNYMTNIEGVFAAGDMRIGQSLVVRAINEGRAAAIGVHRWLKANKER